MPPADAAEPAEHRCPSAPTVTVLTPDPVDVPAVCDGAWRAIGFLAAAGLQPPEGARIELVERMPEGLRDNSAGCYIRGARRILLLRYAAFAQRGHWFGLAVDRDLYRSAAAHEMAHAVVGCHADLYLPGPAHEYVAYVTMFATMDPAVRERVLARFPGTGFDSVMQINPTVYFLDPLQFGAEAWRHYLRQPDRAAWLREVVAGRAVPEMQLDVPR